MEDNKLIKQNMNMSMSMSMSINLPNEIILEIILCLPIKSLMRFRCVNKTWLQLLTNDPQFAQLYLTKSGKNKPIFLALRFEQEQIISRKPFYSSAVELRSDSGKLAAVPLELPFYSTSNKYYKIDGIRNGLILVSLDDDKQNLFIWNPLTNDYIVIPYPHIPTHCLGFRHCRVVTSFGFGFIQATNQYKVIRFCDCYEDPFGLKLHVSVYTLGVDSSWRNLKDISYHSIVLNCTAPLVNEVLHWNASIDPINLDSNILSFDMKDEIFGEIPHPKHVNAKNYPHAYYDSVGELDGLLCLLVRDWGENIQVWVMKEYGVADSWTKQYTIGQPDISGQFTFLQPIGCSQKEINLLQIRTLTQQVILYNPETDSITNLKELGLRLYAAYAYTPTLISPRVVIGDRNLLAVRHTAFTPNLISPGATNGVGFSHRLQMYATTSSKPGRKGLAKKVGTCRRLDV